MVTSHGNNATRRKIGGAGRLTHDRELGVIVGHKIMNDGGHFGGAAFASGTEKRRQPTATMDPSTQLRQVDRHRTGSKH